MSLCLSSSFGAFGDDTSDGDATVPPTGGLTTWSSGQVPPTGGLYDYGVTTPEDDAPSSAGMTLLTVLAIAPLLLL